MSSFIPYDPTGQKRRGKIAADEWQIYHAQLKLLYENEKLETLMTIMKVKHGFHARSVDSSYLQGYFVG
jgi:hypothetical protein